MNRASRVASWYDRHPAWKLTAIVVVIGIVNLLWTSHAIVQSNDNRRAIIGNSAETKAAAAAAVRTAIAVNNLTWCDSLVTITSGKQPTPEQPATAKLYANFHVLEAKFGCDS